MIIPFETFPASISPAQARAWEAAQPAMAALGAVLEPARKHLAEPAPGEAQALARHAFRPVLRCAGPLGLPALLPLHLPVSWGALAARHALAAAYLEAFRAAYWGWDDVVGHYRWDLPYSEAELAAARDADAESGADDAGDGDGWTGETLEHFRDDSQALPPRTPGTAAT